MVVHKHFRVHWKLKTHRLSVGQERDACSTYHIEEKEFSDCEIALDSREVQEANCQLSTAHFVFSGQHFMTSHSCRWANVQGELLLVPRHHRGLISCLQFHDCPQAYQHLFLTRSWENTAKLPSELLTYLNVNDLLVLYPTRSTAYQDVRMGR